MSPEPRRIRPVAARLSGAGGALGAPVGNARQVWAQRSSVVVGLLDASGTVGLGEAAPLPGVSRETLEEVLRELTALRTLRAWPALEGSDPVRLTDAAEAWTDQVLARDASPAARFALTTALLDLAGQRWGAPLVTLLGGDLGSDADVEVSALLGDPHAPGALAKAEERIRQGARTLKLKLGGRTIDEDVAAVGALRRALGPEVGLFGDANGAWDLDEARRALQGLAPLGVLFVEQPVAPPRLGELGRCAVDVWADESLADPVLQRAAAEAPDVVGFACKPTILGGFGPVRALARVAKERGKGVAVTHAFEGPISLAACAALAASLADQAPRAGLWPHEALAAHPAVAPPFDRGRLRLSPHGGLGLSPEEREALTPQEPWATSI